MVRHTLFSLIAGLMLGFFLVQRSTFFHHALERMVHNVLCTNAQIACSVRVRKVNLFFGTIVFDEIQLSDRQEAWSAQIKQVTARFSWMDLIGLGMCPLQVRVAEFAVCDENAGGGLSAYLDQLYQQPVGCLPCVIKGLEIARGQAELSSQEGWHGAVCWNSKSRLMGDYFKTAASIRSGQLSREGVIYLDRAEGSVHFDVHSAAYEQNYIIHVNAQAEVGQLAHPLCFVTGTWDFDHGRCAVRTADYQWSVDPFICTKDSDGFMCNWTAQLPADYIAQLALPVLARECQLSGGSCRMQGMCRFTPDWSVGHADLHLFCEEVASQFVTESMHAKAALHTRGPQWYGTCDARIAATDYGSSWQWDTRTKEGTLSLHNLSSTASLPLAAGWYVKPYDGSLKLVFGGKQVSGTCAVGATHDLSKQPCQFSSEGAWDFGEGWRLSAACQGYKGMITGVSVYPYVSACTLTHEGEACFTACRKQKDEADQSGVSLPTREPVFESELSLGWLNQLIQHRDGSGLNAEGAVGVTTQIHDRTLVNKFALCNGAVRLPQTYNFITGLSGTVEVDLGHKEIVGHELSCSLHAGTAYCGHATLFFDDQFQPTYWYVPILFDRCMLNLSRDIFAMVSGYMACTSVNHTPVLSGTVYVDRAQLRENIFSFLSQASPMATGPVYGWPGASQGCLLDFSIQTKDFVRVDTDFLHTNAHLNLHVGKELHSPEVTGTIVLNNGMLHFPYKPLLITQGRFTFLPGNGFDPLIEFVAQNSIKKHHVQLSVGGTVTHPYVTLDTTPPLTEEQAVSLLLVGSHEATLSSMMPALLVQNMQKALFGSSKHSWHKLNNWTKPFGVQIMPSFTDQTGRGGLRGTIEIDVSERLHALIQKNFNLTEDTRFEMEYLVSDHISIRGIRDERRDIAGEIEMRWKF